MAMSGHLEPAEFRLELVELLSRAIPFGDDDDLEQLAALDDEVGIPTCALVVVEWQASTGRRWLSRMAIRGDGDEAPPWVLRMLAREALEWDEHDVGGEGDE
jgi:hypothetical protein